MQLPLDYQCPAQALAERVVLITGASAGIGRAASLAFARHGATVVLLGRSVKKLESVYDAIEAEGGPTPAIFPLDLLRATPDTVGALAESIRDELGRLDGVLLNAGILGPLTPIVHYPPQTWLEVMQVNVNANFLLASTLLPLLADSDDARLVLTSSGVGRRGRAYWGAYSVSKFALEGMMQVLAEETPADAALKVMSLNPGATRTNMRAAAAPGEDPMTLKSAEELMPAYLYVFGPEGRALHGMALSAQ